MDSEDFRYTLSSGKKAGLKSDCVCVCVRVCVCVYVRVFVPEFGCQPSKNLKGWYGLFKADHTPSNFSKAIFYKFYLFHS